MDGAFSVAEHGAAAAEQAREDAERRAEHVDFDRHSIGHVSLRRNGEAAADV